ncbi:MAG TPA: acyl carrier protein [Gemmatimonadaceae bacterium]|nr:acyl carrier protein [Gemmatimonadaceae bacterium]
MQRSGLIQFIQTNLLRDQGTIDADESLIDRGIVDSIGLMQLMQFIETNEGIRIPDHMVIPENFQSVTAIEQMVEKLRS